jgi:hypothetical protein
LEGMVHDSSAIYVPVMVTMPSCPIYAEAQALEKQGAS